MDITKAAMEYKVFTTPKELRRIADNMERKFPMLPKGTNEFHTWVGADEVIKICMDQSKWCKGE